MIVVNFANCGDFYPLWWLLQIVLSYGRTDYSAQDFSAQNKNGLFGAKKWDYSAQNKNGLFGAKQKQTFQRKNQFTKPNSAEQSLSRFFSSELLLSGSERRRQPERLQTCYENHDAVRITGTYFGLPGLWKLLNYYVIFGLFNQSVHFQLIWAVAYLSGL